MYSARTVVLFSLFAATLAYSPKYRACQTQKAAHVSPLTGCPDGTLYVSADDTSADFATIQEAVLSLPDTDAAVILIGAGAYYEVVNVTRSGPLTLLVRVIANASSDNQAQAGQITESEPTSNMSANLVTIWSNSYVKTGMDDSDSAVLIVAPNQAGALIGSGPTGAPLQPFFGCTDFKAYNIDFQNRAANYAISQALVTDISYANASFYGCSFASYQDTWYTGRNASTYVVDSVIYGETDYLFGFGTAWFQSVTLANRACGGGIAVWKGTNLTDAPGNRYGVYIADSSIIRSPDANATTVTYEECYLGRPWNDLATSVYLRTYMDDSINPAGWTPFDSARPTIENTTYYAENDSHGPGGNTSERVPQDHILTDKEVEELAFTIPGVFLETPTWIDFDYEFSYSQNLVHKGH
ncbi:carbohydrate esterase family 8 protein [Fistulina hepatica ATCC 64428]|uniref:pectinesterase n=1 Tax=Fistulina hepatica ATCC 64428 TaxID=1128425 RepID=A0A0D7ALF8_9AGAR|nr:carbohydrate esterase family 8 protein [Fistulina hepatica ATCC 64428]